MTRRERRIRKEQERREWLLRCRTEHGAVAVCSVTVSNGSIELLGPDDRFCFSLEEVEIAAFRAALDAAIARAEADLAAGPLDNPRAEAVRVSR
ncbi:hypothetical protein ACFFSW_20750 [Saccharothrix longispora]|uniref:YbaB/EbfC DNA-binding family protein n=1 Tax=Saccharothrix longispora TaxID=33920 RepID=A0ABU1Q314_9PSEU|nr:hypothetical protein [Saccharothrix longispora]MDR6597292.1 hypothetical protein [Saccharothrix longispora]